MTHRLMHEDVGKGANMQRSKESQTGGAKQAYQHRMEQRRCKSSTPTPRRYISQVVTSKQTLGGTNVATHAQAHGGHKVWQNLDLERLTWR